MPSPDSFKCVVQTLASDLLATNPLALSWTDSQPCVRHQKRTSAMGKWGFYAQLCRSKQCVPHSVRVLLPQKLSIHQPLVVQHLKSQRKMGQYKDSFSLQNKGFYLGFLLLLFVFFVFLTGWIFFFYCRHQKSEKIKTSVLPFPSRVSGCISSSSPPLYVIPASQTSISIMSPVLRLHLHSSFNSFVLHCK